MSGNQAGEQQRFIVELSPTQVGQIVREVFGESPSRMMLKDKIDEMRIAIDAALNKPDLDAGKISHSALKAFNVLCAFGPPGTERGVTEVARELDMNLSTAKRYIDTLVLAALLERSSRFAKYRIR